MRIDGEIIEMATKDNSYSVAKFFSKTMPAIHGASAYIEDSLTRVLWNPGESDW